MSYEAITAAEVVPDMGLTSELGQKIKDNFDYLYSQIAGVGGGGVSNGDFEIDSDSDNLPDVWTVTTYSGGSASLDTASPASGSKCLKFTHPGGTGNGGGYADSDFVPFYKQGYISVLLKATAACKNKVVARYYDKDKAFISETTLDERTNNPNNWAMLIGCFSTELSNACYVKIRLIGGYTDTNVAATIYWDNVRIYQYMPNRFYFPYTFSDTTFTNGTFADLITQTVTLPMLMTGMTAQYWAGMKITMTVDAYTSGGTDAHLRLKIGANYGTDMTITATGWNITSLPLYFAGDTTTYGGTVSLVVQTYRASSGTGHARKLSAYGLIEVLAY